LEKPVSSDNDHYEFASEEIARHIEDSATSKVAHFRIADKYGKLETTMQWISAFSFSGIVVFWFVSTQVFALLGDFGFQISPAWRTTTQSAIPIAFVIASIIATTFLFLNRYGEKSRAHREAAQRYHRFWRKCINWQTECPNASFAAALADKAVSYRDELSEINHASPDIEEWAWKLVDSELEKGGTKYDVDEGAS